MALFGRSRSAAPEQDGSLLAELMSTGRDSLDAGQLVRALARSIVHVPMPGAPPVAQPTRVSGSADEEPPIYAVQDDDGTHAFIYSTPRRLVEAFGDGVGAASMPFRTLLAHLPEGVDLVIDPGHADALEVPEPVLRHVALEIVGVPTGTAVQPGPDETSRVPEPDLVQLIGATREYAVGVPEIAALYRAESLAGVPSARPVLDLLVELDELSDERLDEVMAGLVQAAEEVEARPLRVQVVVGGQPRVTTEAGAELVERVRRTDGPFYVRSATS